MTSKLFNIHLKPEKARPVLNGMAYALTAIIIVISILLIATAVQTRINNPLHSPALDSLMSQLRETPQDTVLRGQIRALDMLARKAYFTSLYQLRTGGILLLGCLALLLLVSKMKFDIHKKFPLPDKCADTQMTWLNMVKTRKWIGIAGLVILALSWTAAHLQSNMPFTQPEEEITADQTQIWPNFRGPGGNGIAAVTSAPIHWNGESGDNILWKTEVPLKGFSSPVVWEDRIYITGADRDRQVLYCHNADNGRLLWTAEIKDIPRQTDRKPSIYSDTGWAPSTAATNGSIIAVIFPTGDLAAVNADGKIVWSVNLGLPDNHYGHASSLIIHENLLIVQYDQNSDARIMAFDINNGEMKWRTGRNAISWASPICVNTGSRWELIVTNSASVSSYDPADGLSLWNHDVMSGEMGPSPAYADGWVYAATDYASCVGIDLKNGSGSVAWEYFDYLPDTASPLATDDYLFIACSYGTMVCLDNKTGEVLWEHEFEFGFYASPVLVGDLVYAVDLDGVTHIFRAADEFEFIAENPLGEYSACTPAFTEGRIYMRGDKYLYAIGI